MDNEKYEGMPRAGTWDSSTGRGNVDTSLPPRRGRGWSALRRRLSEVADDYEMKTPVTPRIPSFGAQQRVSLQRPHVDNL